VKRRRITDRRYLKWIKSLGCLVAGKLDECQGPIDPDHTTPVSLGGSDYTAVPLCRKHHDLANRRDWFQVRYSVLFQYEVERLNREYPRLKQCIRERKPRVRRDKKLVRAWAMLTPEGSIAFPIFETLHEAQQRSSGKIVRCRIELEGR